MQVSLFSSSISRLTGRVLESTSPLAISKVEMRKQRWSFFAPMLEVKELVYVGVSMGGAATLLASPALDVNAMVLEMVYPTIDEAVSNRLTMRLGRWAGILTPLLTWQLKPRLGISSDALKPIAKVREIPIPKLFIAGAEDQHTTLQESKEIFAAAAEPKELWIVEGAKHTDLYADSKVEYEQRLLSFFQSRLATQQMCHDYP